MKLLYTILLIVILSFNSEAQYHSLVPFQKDNKWGFVDTNMVIKISPIYDSTSILIGNRAIIKLKGKYGLINQSGKIIIKPKYKNIYSNNGLRTITGVKRNSKTLIFDKNGNKIKRHYCFSICGTGLPLYLDPMRYSIKKDNKIALIYNKVTTDSTNRILFIKDTTDYHYSSIESFGEDSFIVTDSTSTGIWIPDEFYIKIFSRKDEIIVTKRTFKNDNLHKFKLNNSWGLIDVNGEIVVKEKYHSIKFDDSEWSIDPLILVEYKQGKYGYINRTGKEYFFTN